MNFKTQLYNISMDLKRHSQKDKTALLQESIENRLQSALNNYSKVIDDSYNYLSYRQSFRVMTKLNKRKPK